jgi:hypothetical protein
MYHEVGLIQNFQYHMSIRSILRVNPHYHHLASYSYNMNKRHQLEGEEREREREEMKEMMLLMKEQLKQKGAVYQKSMKLNSWCSNRIHLS